MKREIAWTQSLRDITWLMLIVLACCAPVWTQVATGGGYVLDQSVVSCGGGQSTGNGGRRVDGTIGQSVLGRSYGNIYDLFSGFWAFWTCEPSTATVTGGGTICPGGTAQITVTVSGGFAPYTVTLTNGGGSQTGNGPFIFNVSPLTATSYALFSGMDVNGCPLTGQGSAQVTVNPATTITTPPTSQTRTLGQSVTFSVTATGLNLSYQWRKNQQPLNGATQSSYTINAVTFADTGSYDVIVSGLCGMVTSTPAMLLVNCPPITFNQTTLPNGVQGAAYNQTLAASPAGGNYSYAVTAGALPPGLTLASNGSLSGTPTANGNYSFAVRATGWGACQGTQSYSLLISGTCAALTINPTTLNSGTLGAAYNQTISATGGVAPLTFSVTQGALPPGLTLNTNTGALTGTPTQSGSYSFRVTATGTGGCTGSRNYVVTISCATLMFTPATLPNGTRGTAYHQQLTVSPASNVTFSLMLGSLPAGFTLNSAGLLSGLTNQSGTYNFTVKALAGSCQGTKAYTLFISSGQAALALSGDYDGDGQSDPALWSAKDGVWRIKQSSNGQALNQPWGTAGDVALLGDYDGDGKSDLAVFRPADATFYLKRSSDGGVFVKAWGLSTDLPVPGDYDGDGKTDIAVWRGSTGTWYILYTGRSSDGQYDVQTWGAGYAPYSDVPVPGDYDGDGKSDVAVFRRGSGTWLVKRSSDGQYIIKQWGLGMDVPVAQDYDGDGRTDIAVWRSGLWYIWQSATNNARVTEWGTADDQASAGDYDGDGKCDLTIWRASNGWWYVWQSRDNATRTQSQGQNGDQPVTAKPQS